MYVGCSGATYVYAYYITDRACICGKIIFFGSGRCKRGIPIYIWKWKGHPSKLHGVRKNLL